MSFTPDPDYGLIKPISAAVSYGVWASAPLFGQLSSCDSRKARTRLEARYRRHQEGPANFCSLSAVPTSQIAVRISSNAATLFSSTSPGTPWPPASFSAVFTSRS